MAQKEEKGNTYCPEFEQIFKILEKMGEKEESLPAFVFMARANGEMVDDKGSRDVSGGDYIERLFLTVCFLVGLGRKYGMSDKTILKAVKFCLRQRKELEAKGESEA